MDLELYLCRHGETAWTITGQHTGTSDLGLTDTGRKQAVVLSKRLHPIRFSLILSSPMKRAVETAELAGYRPILNPHAAEWNYGSYEGKTSAEIDRENPDWDLFAEGAPDGEMPDDVAKRADLLLDIIRKQTGPVILFSHGHFLRMIAARWLDLTFEQASRLYLSVASLSILGFEHQKPVLKLWNETLC